MARKPLVTFEGWDGQWWRRIKVGKAVWDAATFVMPFKWSIALWAAEEAGGMIGGALRRASKKGKPQRHYRRR